MGFLPHLAGSGRRVSRGERLFFGCEMGGGEGFKIRYSPPETHLTNCKPVVYPFISCAVCQMAMHEVKKNACTETTVLPGIEGRHHLVC